MDIKELKKIGLTDGELKVYEALLDLGETTRTELAMKSGISPSKIYDVANRLIEKGIVSSVKKQGVIHFSAADPNRLKDLVEKKEEEIDTEKDIVNNLLPILLGKYQNTKEKADIEVFYGWEGMKTAYDDIVKTLKNKEKHYVFGASKGQDPEMTRIFFMQFNKKVRQKGFATNIIFNEDMRGGELTLQYLKSPHKAKFLYRETFVELNIYGNNVLFVMLLKKPIVIRIRSKEAFDSCKKFFDTMWNLAKP